MKDYHDLYFCGILLLADVQDIIWERQVYDKSMTMQKYDKN